ncbi:MAG: HPr family phosphocarrier protein [Clostridiales bacterium]|nr:HPr family phosphocarrier protein [Clostridiales bacterium]
MKSIKVHLSYIDDVKKIVESANHMKCDVDLVSGRYVIDAKSIMGIFSLDFSKPITLEIHGNDEEADNFIKEIKDYVVEE